MEGVERKLFFALLASALNGDSLFEAATKVLTGALNLKTNERRPGMSAITQVFWNMLKDISIH